MIFELILAILIGMVLGFVLHKWIVKEDLLIAAKVKALVGEKIAAAKAEAAKIAGAVKPEEKK